MSGNEVIVFVVFLALGYWIVSAFLQRTPSQTWHRVLRVNADASVEEIRAAYERRMSEHHPDKVAREITAAYQEAMRSRGSTS